MKQLSTHDIQVGSGLTVSKTGSKYNTWVGAESVEIDSQVTRIEIDQYTLQEMVFNDFNSKQKLANEIQTQMDIMLRTRLKDFIKEALKLDVIIWKDEDAEKFTAQVIIDGDVCLEKTVQVA